MSTPPPPPPPLPSLPPPPADEVYPEGTFLEEAHRYSGSSSSSSSSEYYQHMHEQQQLTQTTGRDSFFDVPSPSFRAEAEPPVTAAGESYDSYISSDEDYESPPHECDLDSEAGYTTQSSHSQPPPPPLQMRTSTPPPPPPVAVAAVANASHREEEEPPMQPRMSRAPPPRPSRSEIPRASVAAMVSLPPKPSRSVHSRSQSQEDSEQVEENQQQQQEQQQQEQQQTPVFSGGNTALAGEEPFTAVPPDVAFEQMEDGLFTLRRIRKLLTKMQTLQEQYVRQVETLFGTEHEKMARHREDGMVRTNELLRAFQRAVLAPAQLQGQVLDVLVEKVAEPALEFQQRSEAELAELRRRQSCSMTAMQKAMSEIAPARHKAVAAIEAARAASMGSKNKSTSGLRAKLLRSNKRSDAEITRLRGNAQNEIEEYRRALSGANAASESYHESLRLVLAAVDKAERQRIQICRHSMEMFVKYQRAQLIAPLSSLIDQVDEKLDDLTDNVSVDIQNFCRQAVNRHGAAPQHREMHYDLPEWRNVFSSLEDAMAIDEEQRQTEASAGGPPRLSFAETREERRVPRIVTSLTRRIRELDGFRAEGIFRLSAGADDLAQLRTQLVGGDYRIERAKGGNDPIVPAAMLKEWLRGLREPLIPFSQYDFCIERAKNKDLTAGRILKLMAKLPESNRALLEYLIKMLQEASQEEYVVTSKMTLPNLAIVFSPSFLRSPNDDPALAIMNTKFETEFVIALVKNCTYSSTG